MEYEVAKSRQFPDEWVVEAIDYASEGEIYGALFNGPKAEERAREYAAWKNAQTEVARNGIAALAQ